MAEIIKVTIKQILGSDILVSILGEEHDGIIRKRELSWDRTSPIDYSQFPIGQQLETVKLQDKRQSKYQLLSLCRLTNPWKIAKENNQLYKGQHVECIVVNVLRNAVFVQVLPGVDAHIDATHLSYLFPKKSTERIVQVGDAVRGIITSLDWPRQQMSVSLIRYQNYLNDLSPAERMELQRDLFVTESDTQPYLRKSKSQNGLKKKVFAPQMLIGSNFLLIDDEIELAQPLVKTIEDEFENTVFLAANSTEAIKVLQDKEHKIGLILVDYNLGNQNGLEIAENLIEEYPHLVVIIVSNAPQSYLEGRNGWAEKQFEFSFKDAELLVPKIYEVRRGYVKYFYDEDKLTKQDRVLHQVGAAKHGQEPLHVSLNATLNDLKQKTNIEYLFVLEVDTQARKVHIVGAAPTIDDIERDLGEGRLIRSLDRLFYSPVRNIILEQGNFYKTNIPKNRPASLKYLFPLLDYDVCYGVPIILPSISSRYLLFAFDKHRMTLSQMVREQIQIYSLLLRSSLEQSINFEYMRRFEQRYTAGELLGSMIHELRNKLSSIDPLSDQLDQIAQRLSQENLPVDERQKLTQKLVKRTSRLVKRRDELKELVNAYSQVAHGNLERIDLNQIIHKVRRELQPYAREHNVFFDIKYKVGLPFGWGNSLAVEQILLNLIRNGIQQAYRQSVAHSKISTRRSKVPSTLFKENLVLIETHYDIGEVCPIRITVTDTGPGIQKAQQEDIFLIDTTSRKEGQGLGLYISRNLASMMGGRLELAHSSLFLGSCFELYLRELGDLKEATESES